MENFEKCTVAMLGGPCSQHVTGNTSRQNQPQSAIIRSRPKLNYGTGRDFRVGPRGNNRSFPETHERERVPVKKIGSRDSIFGLVNSTYSFEITNHNQHASNIKYLTNLIKNRVSSHEPSQNSLTFPWHFPDHFVVFPDHETYHRHFITALTLILQAIWQITHQK